MAEVLHMLPKWMTRPDVEKSDWFNDILVLLWPYLRPGVEEEIKKAIETQADGPYSPFTTVEEYNVFRFLMFFWGPTFLPRFPRTITVPDCVVCTMSLVTSC